MPMPKYRIVHSWTPRN